MATLSNGGNDIDFKGILFNCILETTGFGRNSTKPCDQRRQDTHALIDDPQLVNNIAKYKTIDRLRTVIKISIGIDDFIYNYRRGNRGIALNDEQVKKDHGRSFSIQ
jgi:hypothetical protein